VNELEIKSQSMLVTERGSLSILKEFLEKQEALLDIQEANFIAASDEIFRELKVANIRIDESQHGIDYLKSQTRTMLSELQASIK
jgi:hypothetical protein